MYCKLICILYALLCWQSFILVKSWCYSLDLKVLTPIHDTFHEVIPGQSSTPIGCIGLKVSYGTGDKKHKEILMFEVASFDIRYN
jgi:hypothetical protein